MRVALGGHALSQVELRNTKAGRILSLPCLGFPRMTYSHLQAVELGQGLTLPGLSFPSCKLRFLHAYLTGGNPTQSTRSLFLLLATTGPGLEEASPFGASVGGSSGVQFNMPVCLPRGCRGVQPPHGAQQAYEFWLGPVPALGICSQCPLAAILAWLPEFG